MSGWNEGAKTAVQKKQDATPGLQANAQGGAAGSVVQLKSALRCMELADQEHALAPPGPFTVQARGDVDADANVQAEAARGVSGSGGSLPHAEQIQASFGRHSVSGIQAHVGGEAATATQAMGATAYATGNQVAFGSSPDLHTAAHEAAHVVQQRGGVQLKGGVGQSGDAYEQHADAVADLVVQGKSAEGLLNQYAAPSPAAASSGGAVQFAGQQGEFQTQQKLDDHYDKHQTQQSDSGGNYGDSDAYEQAAMAIVNGGYTHTGSKGSTTYYWKDSTSQFVAVRGGYIRTMFVPGAGKAYFDQQIA